jgi:hypothetical protein
MRIRVPKISRNHVGQTLYVDAAPPVHAMGTRSETCNFLLDGHWINGTSLCFCSTTNSCEVWRLSATRDTFDISKYVLHAHE